MSRVFKNSARVHWRAIIDRVVKSGRVPRTIGRNESLAGPLARTRVGRPPEERPRARSGLNTAIKAKPR